MAQRHRLEALARSAATRTAAALAGCLALVGCNPNQVASGVRHVDHNVSANRTTIDQFTAGLAAAGPKAFAVTYRTDGLTPAIVRYAVRPPKRLAFRETPAGGASPRTDIVANASGEYSCAPPAAGRGSSWTCQKLGAARSAIENQVLDLYAPAHWVAVLKAYSLAAGFAGVKVSQSRLTVHGFRLRCVDYRAAGVTGTSTVCTTAQGILGYVKVAGASTGFEIVSYSASPAASLFELPPGAIVTRPPK
jgi:hypothetical protein